MLEEGVALGIPAPDIWDWTFGEVLLHIRQSRERQRRELQELSVLAYQHACLLGEVFSGGGKPLPQVWERFPFWTQEERVEQEREKYMNIMREYAARGGGHRAESSRQGD